MFFYDKDGLTVMKFVSIQTLNAEKVIIVFKDFRLVITGEKFYASLFRKEEIHIKGILKKLEIKYEK